MLKIYTAVALVVALAVGVAVAFGTSKDSQLACERRTVICAGGSTYYWTSAFAATATVFVLLLFIGYPIIIAGRIGKRKGPPRLPRGHLLRVGRPALQHGAGASNRRA
jgi:hypothetical protein